MLYEYNGAYDRTEQCDNTGKSARCPRSAEDHLSAARASRVPLPCHVVVAVARGKYTGNDVCGVDGGSHGRCREGHRCCVLYFREGIVGQEDEGKARCGDSNRADTVVALDCVDALVTHEAPIRFEVISESLRGALKEIVMQS